MHRGMLPAQIHVKAQHSDRFACIKTCNAANSQLGSSSLWKPLKSYVNAAQALPSFLHSLNQHFERVEGDFANCSSSFGGIKYTRECCHRAHGLHVCIINCKASRCFDRVVVFLLGFAALCLSHSLYGKGISRAIQGRKRGGAVTAG